MNKSYGIIYLVINIQNRKVYVGQTIRSLNDRKSSHKHNASHNRKNCYFYEAIRKYGWDNFKWICLGYCSSQKELDESERECIDFFDAKNKVYGYNLTDGGMTSKGYKHSQESKDKMSKHKLNKKTQAENPMYGVSMLQRLINKHGDEIGKQKYADWRIKIKEVNKTHNPMLGKNHSEESKRKMSETKRKKFLLKKQKGDNNDNH